MTGSLRQLPGVDRVLSHAEMAALRKVYVHDLLLGLVREELEKARLRVQEGLPAPSVAELALSVRRHTETMGLLTPVVNATGVILHTNLGRAPLSHEAIEAAIDVARGYSNLELDLGTGVRGSRMLHVQELLRRATSAPAAFVVNNNAGAILLGLTALCKGKEVIISRGQAVEIGGGFRIPDVMRQSGTRLVEVGTTNRTRLDDYRAAISPKTAALLRAHTSNFRVVGFTESVSLSDMVALAREHNLTVLDDVGSGCLLETTQFGLGPEPKVQDSVTAGADLVFFSGDKLLGGPQAGIVVGRGDLMARLQRHPLARALRVDKMNLAALAATLLHYLKGEATSKVPVWRMIAMPLASIDTRAREWAAATSHVGGVIDGFSMIGGGSLPEEMLPTRLVAVRPAGGRSCLSVQALAQRLRANRPPVITRIEKDVLLLDPRTVLPEQDATVIRALQSVLAPHS
jgi:L-seryl-tRNA(Ser) seleniumtransferase